MKKNKTRSSKKHGWPMVDATPMDLDEEIQKTQTLEKAWPTHAS